MIAQPTTNPVTIPTVKSGEIRQWRTTNRVSIAVAFNHQKALLTESCQASARRNETRRDLTTDFADEHGSFGHIRVSVCLPCDSCEILILRFLDCEPTRRLPKSSRQNTTPQ